MGVAIMARAVGNWMLNVPSAAAAQSCCGGARAGKDVRIGPRGLGRLLAARGVHNATGFRLHALQQRQRPKARNLSGGSGVVRCAMNDDVASPSAATVYQGIYGPWSVDSADIREVGIRFIWPFEEFFNSEESSEFSGKFVVLTSVTESRIVHCRISSNS